MIRSFVLASSLAAALTACGADSTGITATCPPAGTTLSYANYGAAVIQEKCLECHTSRESPTLTTQEAVQKHRASIINAAVETTAMPEDGDMTLDERRMLGEWLACGAP
ncbi:MAG TPA: hypothetical protein VFQ53_33620 [Kofleriaceae bacterium]|nr:hypothetical protein [Kofleriaceae bacterium]